MKHYLCHPHPRHLEFFTHQFNHFLYLKRNQHKFNNNNLRTELAAKSNNKKKVSTQLHPTANYINELILRQNKTY